MKAALRFVVMAIALGTAAYSHGRVGSPSSTARELPGVVNCKNHYILREPCDNAAVDVDIGVVGAVAIGPGGDVYFSGRNIVYRIDALGMLTRVAGNGSPGFSGDGGPAVDALLNIPWWDYPEWQHDFIDNDELIGALALDAAGNLYIGDSYNNRVRRVTPEGVIDTVVGTGVQGGFGGPPIRAEGVPPLKATLWWPQGLAIDAGRGNLFVSDSTGVLLMLAANGATTTLTSNDCGSFSSPGLCAPNGAAVNAASDVFVTDGYCRVRRVRSAGEVETVAGREQPDHGSPVTCGYSGDGGPAIREALAWPFAVAIDVRQNLIIADTYNHCIRKVDADGVITTLAGRCGQEGNAPPYGPAIVAGLRMPHGIAVDAIGNLYIADSGNHRMRKVTPDGIMTTIAGNGASSPEEIPIPPPFQPVPKGG